MLSARAVHGEMGVEDLAAVAAAAFHGFAHRGEHELRVRRVEFLPHRLDEMHEVLLVAGGVAGIAGILFALPEKESGDLVALRAGVVLSSSASTVLA